MWGETESRISSHICITIHTSVVNGRDSGIHTPSSRADSAEHPRSQEGALHVARLCACALDALTPGLG